ncbi:MAG: 3-deoxy-8-phosphooctulonate synthase [Elusimicrobiota bacterium]|jgi:2-dehydro-3-deoxyphosphooctonate aldolase (KDO 8-P synthase)|nr:3-deoxy-8-phosphooctulonate synthase [Elusimicrobiota bacterium]
MKTIKVSNVKFSNDSPLAYIAGPCVIEGEKAYLEAAKKLHALFKKMGKPFVLKASFDKANRTSINAYRGPGIDAGLEILAKAKDLLKTPVLTDIHEPWQADVAAEVADILQIPAFLCRQTDLLVAAGRTGKIVNIKKGQFLTPNGILGAIGKVESTGNKNILLTERGASFGYGDLVVDMRSLQIMKATGYPVIFDLTHSLQKPAGALSGTGGDKTFAATLARSAAAVGIAGVFFEAHPNPKCAMSDSANSLNLKEAEQIVKETSLIDNAAKKILKK